PPVRRSVSEGGARGAVFDRTGTRWAVFSGSRVRLGQMNPSVSAGPDWATLEVPASRAAFDGSSRFLVAATEHAIQVWALPDPGNADGLESAALRGNYAVANDEIEVRGEALVVRDGRTITAFKLPSFEPLLAAPLGDPIWAAALSPEGDVLAATTGDVL